MRIAIALFIALGQASVAAHELDELTAPRALSPFDSVVLGFLLIIGALYAVGSRRLSQIGAKRRAFEPIAFAVGWAALMVSVLPPIDALAIELFSVHMAQHELMMLVGGPLVMAGRPVPVWLIALPPALKRTAVAILQSRSLIEGFIERRNLLGELLPNRKKPTLWFGVKEFKEGVLTIKDDKRTGLITIDIDWKDASVAAQWANGFVALANERIRARAIDESTRNIAFLTKQVSQTSVVEVQHALYGLIENETKTLMLANARVEYAFTVIDPAVPPERKFSPRRSLIVLGGILAGLTIGFMIAYARPALARLKKSNPT